MADLNLNFNSSNVKVFPTSKRSDAFDRQSKLPTEYNFTNIVNRLTRLKSFIVDGLEISSNGATISAGSCSIGGYFFELKEAITNISIPSNVTELYLAINVTENNGFVELSGTDENNQYKGLVLTSNPTGATESLSLAISVDGEWQNNASSLLKYDASDLEVDMGTLTDGLSKAVSGRVSFYNWLNSNFVLDDGEI